MRTHNHLLENVEGCDGFKTGYFSKAGFSIAATAKRNGVRLIAIVMGSKNRKVRDAKATELLNKGFAKVPARPTAAIPVVAETAVTKQQESSPLPTISPQENQSPADLPQNEVSTTDNSDSGWLKFFMGIGVGLLLYAAFDFSRIKRRGRGNRRIRKY